MMFASRKAALESYPNMPKSDTTPTEKPQYWRFSFEDLVNCTRDGITKSETLRLKH